MDIKEYEIGNHCFGPILTVNGTQYNDIPQEEIKKFILNMFENDINSDLLIREVFKLSLEYLQLDCIKNDHDTCEQCGNWNDYRKYKNNQ